MKLWGKQEGQTVLNDIASRSDILLSGLEKGELLTNEKTSEKIAEALLHTKIGLVVVELSADGADYAIKEESAYVYGYKVSQIIDTAEAG